MGYSPDQGEVFYCGGCRRQQPADGQIKCKSCGSTTVSWYTNRESESDAQSKWKRVNGK